MEGTITILSSTLNTLFNYENEQLKISGNYQLDTEAKTLLVINGSANRNTEQGEYVGNFSGSLRDGKMKYTLSDMSIEDTALLTEAIRDIESYIHEKDDK